MSNGKSEHTGSCCPLSDLVDDAAGLPQLHKSDLHPGDQVYILTANSRYHVEVVEDGWFLVSGGWFDCKGLSPFRTKISGCTWGGSALKTDVIAACGLCLEFGNRVVTSAIRAVFHLRHGIQN